MSVNKCLSNTENIKTCFASNNSFSELVGVYSGSSTSSHSCDLAVMYRLLLSYQSTFHSSNAGLAVASLSMTFLKLTSF